MNTKKKKVAILGIVGVPANYGGYETMVDNMLDYTPDDVEYTVYCSAKHYKEKTKEYKGAKLVYYSFDANGPQALIYDALCTINAWRHNTILLSLGNTSAYLYPILSFFYGKRKVIHNYDGHEIVRDKWNRLVRMLFTITTRLTIRYSDFHIADNEAIYPLLKNQYGVDSIIIEYGGDGAFPVKDDAHLKERYGLQPQGYYFNVARIEPENNIHLMLDAFSDMPDRQLVLVGNWHKNQYGEALLKKYKNYGNIKMMAPIYEPNEINLLRSNCKLYIHPHSVGGTNPSLVEAMCLGLPIVAFDVVYNRATTEEKAFYFKDATDLRNIVNNKEGQYTGVATKMKEIADRRYRWEIISKKYSALY